MVAPGQVKLLVRSNALLLREFTLAQMRRVTGAKSSSIGTELQRMKREGLLTSEPLRTDKMGTGAPPHVYRLTDDSQKRLELVRSIEAFYGVQGAAAPMIPVSLNYRAAVNLLDAAERIHTGSKARHSVLARARRHIRLAYQDIGAEEGTRREASEAYLKVAQAQLAQLEGAWAESQRLLAEGRASCQSNGLSEMVDQVEAEMAALSICRGLAEAPDPLAADAFLAGLSRLPRYVPSRILRHVRAALVSGSEGEATSQGHPVTARTSSSFDLPITDEATEQYLEKAVSSAESSAAHFLVKAPPDALALPRPTIESHPWAQPLHMTVPIRVIGVGGSGGKAIDRMIKENLQGVEFIAVNTDAQALVFSAAPYQIRIGDRLTKGLGASGDPQIGAMSAEESKEELRKAVADADIVFITAGIGGGTGTGASPLIGQLAKEAGALTIGVVTKPFTFEGWRRTETAEQGIKQLEAKVDTLIVIPNDRLLDLVDKEAPIREALSLADDVVRQAVQGISDLITSPCLVNLDFSDVRTIMADAGSAAVGIGRASGETRAVDAAHAAVSSPLLGATIDRATGVLLNVTGGTDLTLHELNEAAQVIREMAHPHVHLVFGALMDSDMDDGEIQITVIATGVDPERQWRTGKETSALKDRVTQLPDGTEMPTAPPPRPRPGMES